MIGLKTIIDYCDQYLNINTIRDSSYNGLQIEGSLQVHKIGLGVSCNEKLFDLAEKRGVDLIITHHGLLWSKRWQYIVGVQKKRIKKLIDNNISLAAYHLPLDVHPKIGNNAEGLRRLNVEIKGGFGLIDGQFIGCWGMLPKEILLSQFVDMVNNVFHTNCWYVKKHDQHKIQSVAYVSGGARMCYEEAMLKKYDVFLTGEVNESVPSLDEEGETSYLAAGHYNTEKFGIMALGDLLKKRFKIETEFLDIPNNL